MRRRHPQARSLRVKSIKAALDEFLLAPSGEDGMTNGQLVNAHMGVGGVDLVDPPSYDAVSLKYEKKVRTFREAFTACWRGQRDWAGFDLATLRECDDLGALQLPERVERELSRREEDEERAAIVGEHLAALEESYGPVFEAPELVPPAEIRYSRSRTRRRKRTPRRVRLQRRYKVAKRRYRRAGRALFCFGHPGAPKCAVKKRRSRRRG